MKLLYYFSLLKLDKWIILLPDDIDLVRLEKKCLLTVFFICGVELLITLSYYFMESFKGFDLEGHIVEWLRRVNGVKMQF